jgi:peptidoglycan/LPS O-acetylase OafA/YrhL
LFSIAVSEARPAARPTTATGGVELHVPDSANWLPLLDCLRAVAASVVVIHHINDLGGRPPQIPQGVVGGFGEWGVDIFFVLSAFLLAEYFWRARHPLRAFYIRRFFRIAPAYYAVVLLLFLFFANHKLLFSGAGVRQVLASGTFMHYLFPATSSSLNVDGALWTLTIEMLLYMTLPLMALAVAWKPWQALIGLVLVGFVFRGVIALAGQPLYDLYFGAQSTVPDGVAHLYISRQFLGFVPVFAVGIALRWLLVKRRLPARLMEPLRKVRTPLFFALLLPGLLLLLESGRASDYHHPIWFVSFDLLIGLATVPVLIYASRPVKGTLPVVLRGAEWLGRRSYGLYLWHFPVIVSVYGMTADLGPPQLSHFWIRVVMIWVLAVGLAAASYALVEKPAMDYSAALVRRMTARARA